MFVVYRNKHEKVAFLSDVGNFGHCSGSSHETRPGERHVNNFLIFALRHFSKAAVRVSLLRGVCFCVHVCLLGAQTRSGGVAEEEEFVEAIALFLTELGLCLPWNTPVGPGPVPAGRCCVRSVRSEQSQAGYVEQLGK